MTWHDDITPGVTEGVPADGEGECYSCDAAQVAVPDDVTMDKDPGAEVGGCSDELRTER